MRIFSSSVIAITGLLLFIGCTGTEVGRLSINVPSTDDNIVAKETSLALKKGDEIALWSHMDLVYDGNVELRFRVRMLRDSTELPMIDVDPMEKNVTMNEMKTEANGHTEWSFTGKNHVVQIPEDGTYTFKAILIASENPSLKINAAELVLKQ